MRERPQMHWAASLIGRPYRDGGRGPASFDCWGLVRYAIKQRLAIALPDVAGRATPEAAIRAMQSCGFGAVAAYAVETPRELDGVYMTARRWPHHIGIWIEPDERGGVLHALEGCGVVYQRKCDLEEQGLRIVKFMRLGAA